VKADPRFNQVMERSISGWEGRPAPDIVGMSFDGREIALASYRGKTVLLYAWFTNCPPCVRLAPELAELHNAYEGRGFTVPTHGRVLASYDDSAERSGTERHTIPNIHDR
jgi:thiol-disulfide isomerase/thioredoxin